MFVIIGKAMLTHMFEQHVLPLMIPCLLQVPLLNLKQGTTLDIFPFDTVAPY